MTDDSKARYDDARRRFEDLDLEEQASFLVEAGAATLARGVREVGDALADGLEDVLRQARARSASGSQERSPGAAEPETSQKQAPQEGV